MDSPISVDRLRVGDSIMVDLGDGTEVGPHEVESIDLFEADEEQGRPALYRIALVGDAGRPMFLATDATVSYISGG